MSNLSPQALADTAEAKNEHAYEVWRAWAVEHELEEIERSLRAEFVEVRRRLVVMAVVVLIGLAALFLRIVSLLFAVHGA